MTASPSGKPCRQRASSPASPQAAAERFHIPTTRRSTRSVTRSRTSSPNSRTGGASRRATTDVRILSSQQYASPLPLSSGFDLTSPEPREVIRLVPNAFGHCLRQPYILQALQRHRQRCAAEVVSARAHKRLWQSKLDTFER